MARRENLSPDIKACLETLLLLTTILLNRLGLNSKNSSSPPSSNQNRGKKSRAQNGRKPGGQSGHTGMTLQQVPSPDKILVVKIDRLTLSQRQYHDARHETRQVIDIEINRVIIEWQA